MVQRPKENRTADAVDKECIGILAFHSNTATLIVAFHNANL